MPSTLNAQPSTLMPFPLAKEASRLANDLNNYVEALKKELRDQTGCFDATTNDYKGREDLDASVNLMVQKRKAYELRD